METSRSGVHGPAQRSIRLRIVGGELLLNGRFENWRSHRNAGTDADEASTLLLVVDATSAAGTTAASVETGNVFSFESKKVRRQGSGTYMVDGVVDAGSALVRPMKAVVNTPPGHSAFFTLTFQGGPNEFGAAWEELVSDSATISEGVNEIRSQAWLRTPVLAAA
jgi:hypothetical protein